MVAFNEIPSIEFVGHKTISVWNQKQVFDETGFKLFIASKKTVFEVRSFGIACVRISEKHPKNSHVYRECPHPSYILFNQIQLYIVIYVIKPDKLSGSSIQSGIASTAKPAIGLVNQPNTGVFFCKFLTNMGGIIRRAVINQQDFKIAPRLLKNA